MFRLSWRLILARSERAVLLIIGVLIVSGAYGLLLSAVETTQVIVDEELAQYWHTTYDLLIRPTGSKSPIEMKYGLVQANHLNALNGGITLAQYETIKEIPGIEVAAPIAMIGYFNLFFVSPVAVACESPGFYRLENVIKTNDGVQTYQVGGREFFYCAENDGKFFHLFESPFYNMLQGSIHGVTTQPNETAWPQVTVFRLPVLLAAIDPEQEDRLVQLEQAIVQGQFLNVLEEADTIPLILNTNSYVNFTLETVWKRLDLVWNNEALKTVQAGEGEAYLSKLPAETLQHWLFEGEKAYQEALASLNDHRDWINSISALPGGLVYQEIPLTPGINGPVFQVTPYESGIYSGGLIAVFMPLDTITAENTTMEMRFRQTGIGSGRGGSLPFVIQGEYDIERLARPALVAEVPLETYYPPTVTLRYDPAGKPVPPQTILPTFSDTGYIVSPPLALTTLEAGARLSFAPEKPISAIRVKVAGIETFTPEAQIRIEQIAAEIIQRTGLEVDITVGSSPRRVLTFIPGEGSVEPVGYVEEGWVEKGISYRIGREVKRVNIWLFSVMLLVSGLYILNTSLMSTLARAREIAIQKALGWRSSFVFRMVLMEGGLIGFIAGSLGVGFAFVLATGLGLHMPLQKTLWIIPLGLGLCLIGNLLPATLAARIRPALIISRGEMSESPFTLPGFSLPGYALRQVWARKTRTFIAILTISVATALVTVFLGSIWFARSYLFGTFLGESILVHIGGFHFLAAGISLVIAGFATSDVLLMAVAERRREVGILKAIGWRNRYVFTLFLWEAVGLAGISGLLGWTIGAGVSWFAYHPTLPVLLTLLVPSLLIPVFVSLISAVYPARRATQIPPAEAMRYE